jgi:outer membrane protein TolC
MRGATSVLTSILGALLLGGCSVIPNPFTPVEVTSAADDRLARVAANQEPLAGEIGLDEAMARALKYNLDQKVEALELALRVQELDLAHFNLLPTAVAQTGYAARNNFSGGRSLSLLTGVESLQPSTSQEKQIGTADITFSWHVLDFGLSYVRARQLADKSLIAGEMRRKVVNRIIEDVRTAYWRAVSAERLISQLRTLEERAKSAISSSRALYDARETSPITALTYERELVEVTRTLQELQRELSLAKSQLAALMNVPPGTDFRLAVPRRDATLPKLCYAPRDMVRVAMVNRPELREVSYQQRINEHEVHAALLEMLPGIQLTAGADHDSNALLFNNDWVGWGAKASWNLLKVFSYPSKRRVIDAQAHLLDQRGLAVTMAVMTQVYVSRARFMHYSKELDTARRHLDVQKRLLKQMQAEARSDKISKQTLIREEMNTLVSEVKYDIAYANVQNAFANIFASMGLEPYEGEVYADQPVKAVADALRKSWFERGDFVGRVKASKEKLPICEMREAYPSVVEITQLHDQTSSIGRAHAVSITPAKPGK